MDIEDTPVFFKLLSGLEKSFSLSEKELIKKCEVLKPGETKKLAHAHLGLNFKRLLSQHQIGEHAGTLLTNNLEKEFVRSWIYTNNLCSYKGHGDYLFDSILGHRATDEELIIVNTVIQWLGTSVGMNFIESVTGAQFIKNVGTEKNAV